MLCKFWVSIFKYLTPSKILQNVNMKRHQCEKRGALLTSYQSLWQPGCKDECRLSLDNVQVIIDGSCASMSNLSSHWTHIAANWKCVRLKYQAVSVNLQSHQTLGYSYRLRTAPSAMQRFVIAVSWSTGYRLQQRCLILFTISCFAEFWKGTPAQVLLPWVSSQR